MILEVTENNSKKEFLKQYQKSVRRVRRITAEISEIREMKQGISCGNNTGMPRGGRENSDLSSYVATLDKLERDLIVERYNRIKLYKEIAYRIKRLKSENEKDVLFFRYIRGMEWYEIAEQMKFSERQIYRFHGKALINFQLPEKDVSECQ